MHRASPEEMVEAAPPSWGQLKRRGRTRRQKKRALRRYKSHRDWVEPLRPSPKRRYRRSS